LTRDSVLKLYENIKGSGKTMDVVKFMIEHALYPAMEKRRGNKVRAYTDELLKTQYLGFEEMDALRNSKLKALLLHAVKHVPAYMEIGITQDEIEEDPIKALEKIPPLTKKTFRENSDMYLSDDAKKETLIANKSGGSTSEPVKFFMDRKTVEYYEAARWRGLSWFGITNGSRCAMIWGNPIELELSKQRRYRLKEKWLKNRIIIPAYALDTPKIGEYVRKINSFTPEYIYGYSSALYAFSELVEKSGFKIAAKLKAVVSTAEMLHDYQREKIEQIFACPVVNEYGARDGGIIAMQCENGSMHVSYENMIIETVRPGTFEHTDNGESGIVLITDLNNFVMPRIRYMVGDRASLSEKPCTCGRSLPVISSIDGREDDVFLTKDGKLIHGHIFNHIARDSGVIAKIQMIQEDVDHAELKYVRIEGADDGAVYKFLSDIRAVLPGCEITIHEVPDIPSSPSGKFRYAIRKFPL